jgi:hypothetical protein
MIDANWLSVVIAFGALIFSVIAHRSASKSKARTEQLEEKNSSLVEDQSRLAHHSWADGYFRDVVHWACQMTTAISRAIHFVGSEDIESRREILISIYACIDMGRWYFPNRNEDHFGQEKEPAYRGFRQPLLDWAVRAYEIFENEENYADSKYQLIICQRQFVSVIQEVIDPKSREKSIKKILDDFGPVAGLPTVESPKQP